MPKCVKTTQHGGHSHLNLICVVELLCITAPLLDLSQIIGVIIVRDNLVRANIVLTKNLKKKLKKRAENTHGSVSHYLREAAIEKMNGESESNEVGTTDLDPVLERMEETDNRIDQIESKLENLEEKIGLLVEEKEENTEEVADAVEDVLIESGKPLSISELVDQLSYRENEIRKGLERLEDVFVVKKIEKEDEVTKWKIKGGE